MRGLWLLAVMLLAGCQHVAAPPPISGEIRDLRNGQVLTAQQLLTRLVESERLIIGEQHDNADHHAAQLWLLRSLGEQRPQGSLYWKCSRRISSLALIKCARLQRRPRTSLPHWPGRTAGTGISMDPLSASR